MLLNKALGFWVNRNFSTNVLRPKTIDLSTLIGINDAKSNENFIYGI